MTRFMAICESTAAALRHSRQWLPYYLSHFYIALGSMLSVSNHAFKGHRIIFECIKRVFLEDIHEMIVEYTTEW
jgi:hypothetical protein